MSGFVCTSRTNNESKLDQLLADYVKREENISESIEYQAGVTGGGGGDDIIHRRKSLSLYIYIEREREIYIHIYVYTYMCVSTVGGGGGGGVPGCLSSCECTRSFYSNSKRALFTPSNPCELQGPLIRTPGGSGGGGVPGCLSSCESVIPLFKGLLGT